MQNEKDFRFPFLLFRFFVHYRHLYHPIQLILKDAIGFLNLAQWKTMRDEWGGVNLSLLNKAKDFLAIATIHTACFGWRGSKVLLLRFSSVFSSYLAKSHFF